MSAPPVPRSLGPSKEYSILDAPLGAVAVKLDDFFAKVADAEDDLGETGFFEEADLMGKKTVRPRLR